MEIKEFVSFSGGKDSTALALYKPSAIPIFADTGAEFPEIYQHIRKFESVTNRKVIRVSNEDYTLLEYMKFSKFMPGHRARYCTPDFKINPINEYLSQNLPAVLHIALRADESHRIGNLTDMDGLEISYPFQDDGIDIDGVLKICNNYGLLPHYPIYMARGGCINCFYKRKSEVIAMKYFVPEILDKLQEIEEGIQDQRKKYAIMFPNTGMSIRDIKRQMELFSLDEIYQDANNRNDYGNNCGLFCNR